MTLSNIRIQKAILKTLLLPSVFLLSLNAYGQGCSDAGVCTMNSFKPTNNDSTSKQKTNQIKIGAFLGRADYNITVSGLYLEFNKQFNKKFSADFKLNSLAQSGNNLSNSGLSDFIVNGNYQIKEKSKFTLGLKIPFSKADDQSITLRGFDFPMDYQSSLGTFDLILGVGHQFKKIQLIAAYQQPLIQNANSYDASNFESDSFLNNIQTTNNFKRSGDIMVRVSYPFKVKKNLNLVASLLPIYHLQNDKFTDRFKVEKEIEGSQGLTVNGNIYLDYSINSSNNLQFNVGMPFLVRKSRPDGLTRIFIATLEYSLKF